MPGFNPEPSSIQISRMLRRPPGVSVGMQPMIHAQAPHMHMPRIGRDFGGQIGQQQQGSPIAGVNQAVQRMAKSIPDSPMSPVTGAISTKGLGRSDDVPTHVPPQSYVIPADVVSGLGQGNTSAGFSMLEMMFGSPWGAKGAPWGAQVPKLPQGAGPPKAKSEAHVTGFPTFELGYAPYQGMQQAETGPRAARGGSVPEPGQPQLGTPINASGGEFVVSPHEVRRRGKGNVNIGHAILDNWVKSLRQQHIETLKKLPGPAR